MIMTRESDYAVRILRALAGGEKMTVGRICEAEFVPVQFAYKILKKLAKCGYVEIFRGAAPAQKIVQYIGEHTSDVTLKKAAKHFSYHPNYVSGLLRRETGRTFSEILLEQRMTRAACLLRGTPLSIENIAAMLGYRDSSNFYKAFREYYGKSPREYIKEE